MSSNLKISVIHNVFRQNPYISQTLKFNLRALEESQVDYQYIIFNDHGDETIFDDVKELINNKTEYIYSDINYGKHKCTGGWIGALPYVKGNIIHNIGQDDVMTSLFYQYALNSFLSDNKFKFVTLNAFVVNEDLSWIANGILPNLQYNTKEANIRSLKRCFGLSKPDYKITNLYNPFLASGTLYKKELHDLIGLPDLDTFGGISDFEYWMRILYNGYLGDYHRRFLWYFRQSEKYTTGNEIIDGKPNRAYWHEIANNLLIEKYSKLLEENKQLFI